MKWVKDRRHFKNNINKREYCTCDGALVQLFQVLFLTNNHGNQNSVGPILCLSHYFDKFNMVVFVNTKFGCQDIKYNGND